MVSLTPAIAETRGRGVPSRRDPDPETSRITTPAKKHHPDAAYVEELVERLGAFGPVSARSMFGGFGLYADGAMFGLVSDGALYLRADEANRASFEAVGSRPWTPEMKGRPITMPYYPIPEDDLDDPDALRGWFEGARAAALRVAAAKKPRAPKSPRKKS